MDITEEIIEEEAMNGILKITENKKGGDTTDIDTPGVIIIWHNII